MVGYKIDLQRLAERVLAIRYVILLQPTDNSGIGLNGMARDRLN